ncbi:unnamed protein product [Enterobius vermicularis]|uniref:Uncharacterized protein n=1 Tax=Enterobius vermicularis TaxID=51028 RepID=A0A0N4VLN6_ENTVE|nr:unnamed protein product [Enterobius vermicularis]
MDVDKNWMKLKLKTTMILQWSGRPVVRFCVCELTLAFEPLSALSANGFVSTEDGGTGRRREWTGRERP